MFELLNFRKTKSLVPYLSATTVILTDLNPLNENWLLKNFFVMLHINDH